MLGYFSYVFRLFIAKKNSFLIKKRGGKKKKKKFFLGTPNSPKTKPSTITIN